MEKKYKLISLSLLCLWGTNASELNASSFNAYLFEGKEPFKPYEGYWGPNYEEYQFFLECFRKCVTIRNKHIMDLVIEARGDPKKLLRLLDRVTSRLEQYEKYSKELKEENQKLKEQLDQRAAPQTVYWQAPTPTPVQQVRAPVNTGMDSMSELQKVLAARKKW